MELVEDRAGGILQVRTSKDSDRVGRKLFGELLAAFPILEGSDVRSYCVVVQRFGGVRQAQVVALSPGFSR